MRQLSGVDSSGSHEEATGERLGQSTEGLWYTGKGPCGAALVLPALRLGLDI